VALTAITSFAATTTFVAIAHPCWVAFAGSILQCLTWGRGLGF
jgi:hypothetical protein